MTPATKPRSLAEMRHAANCDARMGGPCNCGEAQNAVSTPLVVERAMRPPGRLLVEFEIGDMIAAIVSMGPGMDIPKYAIKLADAIDERIKELVRGEH